MAASLFFVGWRRVNIIKHYVSTVLPILNSHGRDVREASCRIRHRGDLVKPMLRLRLPMTRMALAPHDISPVVVGTPGKGNNADFQL